MTNAIETYEARVVVSGCVVPVGMDPRSYAAGVAAGILSEATGHTGAVPVHDLEVSQRYQDWLVSAKTTKSVRSNSGSDLYDRTTHSHRAL